MAYRDVVLADAPIGYWRLEETAGTQAADLSGNGRPGTYIGGVTLGQPGALADGSRAATLDGVDDQITVAHDAVFNLTGDFTIEAWVNPANRTTHHDIVSKGVANGATSNTFEFRLNITTGIPVLLQHTGTLQQSLATAAAPLGAWSHLVVTKTGATVRHYLNGALNGTGTINATGVTTTTTPVRLGGRDDGTVWWAGGLDEVAVYATALSAARVTAHYDARTLAGGAFAGQPFAGEPFAGQPFAGEPFAGQN